MSNTAIPYKYDPRISAQKNFMAVIGKCYPELGKLTYDELMDKTKIYLLKTQTGGVIGGHGETELSRFTSQGRPYSKHYNMPLAGNVTNDALWQPYPEFPERLQSTTTPTGKPYSSISVGNMIRIEGIPEKGISGTATIEFIDARPTNWVQQDYPDELYEIFRYQQPNIYYQEVVDIGLTLEEVTTLRPAGASINDPTNEQAIIKPYFRDITTPFFKDFTRLVEMKLNMPPKVIENAIKFERQVVNPSHSVDLMGLAYTRVGDLFIKEHNGERLGAVWFDIRVFSERYFNVFDQFISNIDPTELLPNVQGLSFRNKTMRAIKFGDPEANITTQKKLGNVPEENFPAFLFYTVPTIGDNGFFHTESNEGYIEYKEPFNPIENVYPGAKQDLMEYMPDFNSHAPTRIYFMVRFK